MGFLADVPLADSMGRVVIDDRTNTARLVHATKRGLTSIPIEVTPELRQALGGTPYLDVRLDDGYIYFPLYVRARGHTGNPYGTYSAYIMSVEAQGVPAGWQMVEQRVW